MGFRDGPPSWFWWGTFGKEGKLAKKEAKKLASKVK